MKSSTKALLIAGIVMALPGCMESAAELGETQLNDWLSAYGAAWEDKDPAAAAALFSPDATYRETPYDEPFRGRDEIREYWAGVTSDQTGIDFGFEVIAIDGNTGVAAWSARFMSVSGGVPVELNGVFVLEFADGELVSSLSEWWHAR